MDSKDIKDANAFGDVHVGKPEYADYGDGAAEVETYSGETVQAGHTALKRGLKSRHIAMISIGGVIGTGLFLGTANALKNGGPLGLLLGYAAMGTVCYSVMISLGAMISYLPIPGGHIRLADRFVDPAFGFALGWNYWYNWVIILPAELAAVAVLTSFWDTTGKVNNAVWISIAFAVVALINFLGSGVYGETEFWFCIIKVLTIVGLIILGIILTAGGGPDGEKIGFKFWKDPGPFVQYMGISGTKGRFLGFWAVLSQAAFSYIGTEIVAIAAGEAKNPRRNLPKAIKRVYIRILVFYIGGVLVIGLLVPSNQKGLGLGTSTASGSPFVIAIKRSGIKALPSIINACLITSAWSAASSDLFTSSRALYGLALNGQAPKIFTKTTKNGVPWTALLFSGSFGALAYMSLQSNAGTVFNYFASLTAGAGLITWLGICILYIRFHAGMKAQGIDMRTLPYHSVLNTNAYAAKYAATFISLILIFFAWNVFTNTKSDKFAAGLITNYMPQAVFPLIYLAYKFIKKTKIVRVQDMDFFSGVAEIEADEEPEKEETSRGKRILGWIF